MAQKAKLKIMDIKINQEALALRVDLQFKATVDVEAKKPKTRKVFATETHHFVDGLPVGEESDYLHALPATWRAELEDLLDLLAADISDYIP